MCYFLSQLAHFAVSADLCVEKVLKRVMVPRAVLLIVHVKGLDGGLELLPAECEGEELFFCFVFVSTCCAVLVVINGKTFLGEMGFNRIQAKHRL